MCSKDWGVVLGRSVQYGGPSLLRKRRSNRNSDRTNKGHDGKSSSDENSDDQNGDETQNQNQNGKANNVKKILIQNHWSLHGKLKSKIIDNIFRKEQWWTRRKYQWKKDIGK